MIPPTMFGPTVQPLDPEHPEDWPDGWSPVRTPEDEAFRAATDSGDWPEALARVAAGQNPAVVGGDLGLTALHHLCFARHLPEAMWRTVLEWGLPVNQLDKYGEPPVLTLVSRVRSSRPWNDRAWTVEQDMTRPLLNALIAQGASHGVADSVANGHVPMVLHAAMQRDPKVTEYLELAFEHLPAHEHARGWVWALWGAALQGEDGGLAHRWLMQHPPVWADVDWAEVPYRVLGTVGRRALRHCGNPDQRHGSAIAALTRDGLRERFDELVVERKVATDDALYQVLQGWVLTLDAGQRRERGRQARALVRAGAALYGRVVGPNGRESTPAGAALAISREVQKLITSLEPLERAATTRALRREAQVTLITLDDPPPRARARSRL